MLLLVVSDPRWLSFPLFADVLPIRTDVHLVIGTAHLCRNAQHHEIFKVGSNPVRAHWFSQAYCPKEKGSATEFESPPKIYLHTRRKS